MINLRPKNQKRPNAITMKSKKVEFMNTFITSDTGGPLRKLSQKIRIYDAPIYFRSKKSKKPSAVSDLFIQSQRYKSRSHSKKKTII